LAVFENLDLFDRDLIVERPTDDANRLDVYMPLDHVNQLRIIAVNATSYMQRRSLVDEEVSLTAR
jgi:phage tail sheath gpL-like